MTDSVELPEFRRAFLGSISEAGLFLPDEPGTWIGWLMRHKGKRVTVVVSREKQKRSDAQNRYYWSMVVPIFSEVTGYETEEAHDILKGLFLRERLQLPNGTTVERVGSSAALSTAAFAEYVEKCCRWLATQGWYVPQPGERS